MFVSYFAVLEKRQRKKMGGNLVIVESPAKAVTIQKFLGKDFTVKPSFGHIRDLHDKKLSVDVDNGFSPEYVVPADKKKVVAELKKLAAQVDTVWLASDEDREGEAISWHLAVALGLKPESTRRIVFHEITKDAIQKAVATPRTIDMNLVNAQQARRVLDRLVGFEISPVLWRKIQPKLSAGRVQSVALRLVVDREREILAFHKEPFYSVTALFHPEGTPAPTTVKATLGTKFAGIAEAGQFLCDSAGASFHVAELEKKEGTRHPAAPFTTSTLQQEAARKLHLPVSTTMRIAQQLYERGLITYMRTDSVNLSSLALGTAKKFIIENFGENYSQPRQYRTHSKGAQEAHEAIRPTYIENTSIEGTPQEQKLYTLIWKRTVASQMAEARVLRTDIKIASDKRSEKFSVQATEILFDGFMKVYLEGRDEAPADDEETILPELHQGDVMILKGMDAECKFTAAPARYSEATLVKKLEELGIGRPSTYAPTIATLTTGRGYIARGDKEGEKIPVTNLSLKGGVVCPVQKTETVGAEKGRLLPQEIGMIVTDYLVAHFHTIMDYDFTARVEKDFDSIAEGEMMWTDVIGQFYTPFHQRVSEVLSDGQYSHVERQLGFSEDGKKIIAKFGQYGPYVQKGEGEDRQFANLSQGQLIESITLEEALALFQLPRTVGRYLGTDVIATKGRYGPYLKYGTLNVSLPRGKDPLKVSLEECIGLIVAAQAKGGSREAIAEFPESDIKVLSGAYGPYIKHAGANYKIPRGTDPASLTEADCKEIIESSSPTKKGRFPRRAAKKK